MTYALLIDAIIVVILVVNIVLAYRRGFFRTLFYTGRTALSYIGAMITSQILAPILYERYIATLITTNITQYISNAGGKVRFESVVISALNKIPSFARELLLGKSTEAEFIAQIASKTNQSIDKVADVIVKDYVPDIIIPVLQSLLFLLSLFILMMILRWITDFIAHHLRNSSILGGLDALLGSALGAVAGALLVFAFLYLLKILLSVSADQWSFLNTKIIDSTYLCKYLYHLIA